MQTAVESAESQIIGETSPLNVWICHVHHIGFKAYDNALASFAFCCGLVASSRQY